MIISLDPSGNHKEGFGTTGVCMAWANRHIHKVDEIQAVKFKTPEDYWHQHIKLLKNILEVTGDLEIVMEGFRLYGHKSKEQTNSQFETPQLIGVIRHWCYGAEVPLKIQFAHEVKNRWSDSILQKENIIYTKGRTRYLTATDQVLNNHKTDAVRHMMHYLSYSRGK